MSSSGLLAIGAGSVSAVAATAPLIGSPGGVLFFYVAPLPLLLLGLSKGLPALAIAAAVGCAVAAVVSGAPGLGLFAAIHALPCLILVRVVLRPAVGSPSDPGTAAGTAFTLLTVLAAIGIVVTALSVSGPDGIRAAVGRTLTQALEAANLGGDAEQQQILADAVAPIFFGVTAVPWLLMFAFNAVTAQAMLVARGWSRLPALSARTFRLPDWLSWLVVAAAALGLLAPGDVGFLARNVVIVLLVPYFFLGLAVVHTFAASTRSRGMLLAAFYFTVILFLLFALGVLAILGLIEQWAGLRGRLSAPITKRKE